MKGLSQDGVPDERDNAQHSLEEYVSIAQAKFFEFRISAAEVIIVSTHEQFALLYQSIERDVQANILELPSVRCICTKVWRLSKPGIHFV